MQYTLGIQKLDIEWTFCVVDLISVSRQKIRNQNYFQKQCRIQERDIISPSGIITFSQDKSLNFAEIFPN